MAAGGVALVLAIAAGLIVYRSRKRKQKLAEMAEARTSISADLLLAGRNALQIRQLLDDFKAEMPEQKIEDVSSDLALQPTRIAKVKNDAALLNFANLEEYDRAICVKDSAESEAGLLERTRERLSRIRKAKEDSGVLMEHLSREKFAIPHVRDSTKQEEVDGLLLRGQQMYDQARTRSSDPLLDWLLIHELLYGSQDSMQRALESSQAEPYMPSLSSFDASGSGGSVFGDSGGTDFGGGGGFSGGSGSDGTY
ncbi:MAG TPA: hypothetical protein VFO39_11125 [Candidatus Sulfotelmatobacter sp.]|nr:hypothetical protein [Candidatus Sulfotelmatobacter sp.]